MRKIMLLWVAVLALAVGVAAGVASAGSGGATVTSQVTNPIPGYTGFDFGFWDGNGVWTPHFAPVYFQEVLAPSGVHNEVFSGFVANDSGHAVVYTADSGAPIPSGATCWDMNGVNNFTTDWTMTISASGNYTLRCHFAAP
jgi:hypothetical protein